MDDNLFDDDDSLDYVLFEECEKDVEVDDSRGNGGCLGMIMFFLIMPVAGQFCWRYL